MRNEELAVRNGDADQLADLVDFLGEIVDARQTASRRRLGHEIEMIDSDLAVVCERVLEEIHRRYGLD